MIINYHDIYLKDALLLPTRGQVGVISVDPRPLSLGIVIQVKVLCDVFLKMFQFVHQLMNINFISSPPDTPRHTQTSRGKRENKT